MFYRFFIFLILPCFLIARGKVVYQSGEKDLPPPWLTGPLFAPSSAVIPVGSCNIEPYIFVTANTATYDSHWQTVENPTLWLNSLQTSIQIGLTKWLDFQFSPSLFWNYSQHQTKWVLGDMPIGFDIQLYRSPEKSWIPGIKLILKENVPLGKYRNLNPKKNGTDAAGIGSWMTGVGLVFGHIHHVYSVHYFNYRLLLLYNIPAPVRIKGFSVYGGGYGADARVFPPQNFEIDLGMELTLSQNWAFALDIVGYWADKRRFSGKVGTLGSEETIGILGFDVPASLANGSQAQFSLAPAIEYNWDTDLGAIAGVWFTVAGRNSPVFTSGVIALNYYF